MVIVFTCVPTTKSISMYKVSKNPSTNAARSVYVSAYRESDLGTRCLSVVIIYKNAVASVRATSIKQSLSVVMHLSNLLTTLYKAMHYIMCV